MVMSRHVFDHVVQTSQEWLVSIAREFDTDDLDFVERALRAWMHGLRDELPIESCAHFAAQLPELLRGVYYEGWNPTHAPVDHDVDAYVRRFAREARIRPTEVGQVASTITEALHGRTPEMQLAALLMQLPSPAPMSPC